MPYIKRASEETILSISNMFPVLLVTGPRQVGKTTLLQKLAHIQKSIRPQRTFRYGQQSVVKTATFRQAQRAQRDLPADFQRIDARALRQSCY